MTEAPTDDHDGNVFVPPPGSPLWLRLVAAAISVGMEQTVGIKTTCIASTLLGTHYLARYGITGTPTSVWVAAENLAAQRLRGQKTPISKWPDNAWSVIIRPGVPTQVNVTTEEDWSGHLVIMVRRGPGKPRTLIDPTATQLDRSAHELVIPGPVHLDIPAGTPWSPDEPYIKVVDQIQQNPTFVHYVPASPTAPHTHGWKKSKSYERWHDPAAPLVAEMMDATDRAVRDLSRMFVAEIAQMRDADDPGLQPL